MKALVWAQTPMMVKGPLPATGPIDLQAYAEVFEDSSGEIRSLDEIRRERFIPFTGQGYTNRPKVHSLKVVWFRFRLHNAHPTDTLRAVLYMGRRSLVRLLEEKNELITALGDGGYWVTFNPAKLTIDRYGIPISILPGQTYQYWVQAQEYFRSIDRFRLELYSPQAYQLRYAAEQRQAQPALIFFSAVLGCLLFMSLFTGAQYLLSRDGPYAWYAAYLTGTLLWLWRVADMWFDLVPPIPNPRLFFELTFVLGYGLQIAYMCFLSSLLEVPQYQPWLWHWLRRFLIFIGILMLIAGVEVFQRGFRQDRYPFFAIASVVNYVGLLVLLILMLRSRHPLRQYAVAGSLLILTGIIIAAYLIGSGFTASASLTQIPTTYFALGTLLEILCFSLALGRRHQLIKEEKIQTQQQLIEQLEEIQRLQHSHTLELQRQLAQRETEVLTKANELEEQRVSQLRSDFERRVAEAEMAGLRSQMNPHFIFNCLNSIKLYATENDSEKASEYLTKFSRLIRLVLENSRSECVKLRNELDMLQLYADMEIMRFKQKLSFWVEVEAGIDADFVEIPPLLIQPYVENAIWHGLMHKPTGGTVYVRVSQPQENLLQLTIADDGIGRVRAAELRSKSASHRKSFGLKMTSERIALINQLYQTRTQVEIHDLIDTNGQPAGTEVTLQIPI